MEKLHRESERTVADFKYNPLFSDCTDTLVLPMDLAGDFSR